MTSTKRCSRCGAELQATSEFFGVDNHKSTGLTSRCRKCLREASKEARAKNPERAKERWHRYYWNDPEFHRERVRLYRAENPEKVRKSSREHYAANRERELERNRCYKEINREKILAYSRKYRENNLERERQRARQYRIHNREKELERNRRYRDENPAKLRELNRNWASKNKDKVVLIARRRAARKRELPDTFTHEDWMQAVEYWNGCCAYCGTPTDKLTVDHYIPVSSPDCVGTVVENIVPACSACNTSKKNRDVREWLIYKFGREEASLIQDRILEYFKRINHQIKTKIGE